LRPAFGAAQRYAAGIVPADAAALPSFLRAELAGVEAALQSLAGGQLEVITVAPAKPRDGMLRCAAAGVLGASAGFYGFHSGGWKVLG
jgi:hypothetical protein